MEKHKLKDFMRKAIQLSAEGSYSGKGGPFGAVIVKDGQVIGQGYNQVTSTLDPTAHAEVVAIRNACQHLQKFHLEDCILFTSCEPCPMCLGAIYWAKIRHIYYANSRRDAAQIGFSDDFIYTEFNVPLAERHIPVDQFLREEAQVIFEKWKNNDDKTLY